MRHQFTVITEQDTTVAVAVGAFLDCEHYIFLHKSLMADLSIPKVDGRKIRVREFLRWHGLRFMQEFTMEYIPPGRFRSYDMQGRPWWFPSIHHLVKVVIDVNYTRHPERDTTLMQFDATLDMPFWLYPFRKILQRTLENMHAKKDQEDMDMILRRAQLVGRGNNAAYLAPGQFLLHKDDYVKYFGNAGSDQMTETAQSRISG